MKKVMFIMAAALLMMTQCKKENETSNVPAESTVKMTITAGPGRTDISTSTGAITWSAGDKLYVSDGTNWLGSLTLVGEGGSAQGTFTGSIAAIGEGVTTCHFFYLGHDNGMTEPTGTAAASISFAAQDGTLPGAMKYHLGYGNTNVTMTEGEAIGSVVMNTKIAMAHINFTTADSQPYTGAVTMGGAGISNVMSVSPDGTFSGSGDGGITLGETTTGERYVTLIPAATPIVSVAFTGDATGGMTFLAGIRENKFYGMKDAMTVTLEAAPEPKFTVGMDGVTPITVEFAPGNLYYDGSNRKWKFEANQWDYRTYGSSHSCIGGKVTNNGTPSADWGLFGFSTSSTTYGMSTSTISTDYTGDFKDWGENAIGDDAANTWHTLSQDEWSYLIGKSSPGRDASLCKWSAVTFGESGPIVSGLVIMPDGYEYNTTPLTDGEGTTSYKRWQSLEASGAVFLPAVGYRQGTSVLIDYTYGYGYYWSKTTSALQFGSPYGAYVQGYSSKYGCAVRLVR